jgi:two-component system, chemotaxis family, response regulator PixG
MLTPLSISLIEPPIASYELGNVDDFCKQLHACNRAQFSGRLDITTQNAPTPQWSLFFCIGYLMGGASALHPQRRWYRQLSQHCPRLTQITELDLNPPEGWHERSLARLMWQGKLSQEQVTAVMAGSVVEILFDMMQLEFARSDRATTQVTYRRLPQKTTTTLPARLDPVPLWQQAKQLWDGWQQAGLGNWSPNWAPVIWDAEALRQQTSLLVYHNLTTAMNGDRTLRDLAVRLKQPLLPLTLSLIPYIRKGIMGLVEVNDVSGYERAPSPISHPSVTTSANLQPRSSSPLVAYIEDSRFDCIAMNQILAQAGYRFINIRDPVQSLPILIEQSPDLIFLDLIMPVTNGYEVCGQVRRISMFKNIPIIIVTSSDGIVDRVRAKLAGASGFVSKPIEAEKVLTVLRNHLPFLIASFNHEE